MSRIGKLPILIPQGVTVTAEKSSVIIKGPKGELKTEIRPEISAKTEDGKILIEEKRHTKESNAFWGMTRALIFNMVKGVTEGFEKKLELVGVGYRAKEASGGISLTLGFSHPIEFKAPQGITFEVVDNQNIVVKGSDKQLVGLTAAQIRNLRKPEPYKGKGIKYSGEFIKRKAGKSGKV